MFIMAIPVLLIATNVRWVINAPLLYRYGFDKYDIPARTGIERDELLSAARQIRDYFNGGEEYLTVSVAVGDVRVENLYNPPSYGSNESFGLGREVLHMKDVKGLVSGMYRVQAAAGAYLMAFVVIGLVALRRNFVTSLTRYAGWGGLVTLGLVASVGLVALVGFDRLFLSFHLVSFSNDLWQLDPRRHYLLAMFPQGFFFDATTWIAGLTVVEALLLIAVPAVFLWWRPRRARISASELAAEVR